MDDAGRGDRRQDPGEGQNAADRLLPQRRHHARKATAATINRTLHGPPNRSLFSLTASRDRERSFESPDWGGGHGIFTYYVVKGMEGAADENARRHRDRRRAGRVRPHATCARPPRASRTRPPTAAASTRNMLLSYVPSGAKPGTPPPPKFGTLIFEANMDGVEVFVDGKSVGVVNKGKPAAAARAAARRPHHQGRQDGLRARRPARGDGLSRPGVHRQHQDPDPRAAADRAASDAFDKGLEFYKQGFTTENYRKAAEEFEKALWPPTPPTARRRCTWG